VQAGIRDRGPERPRNGGVVDGGGGPAVSGTAGEGGGEERAAVPASTVLGIDTQVMNQPYLAWAAQGEINVADRVAVHLEREMAHSAPHYGRGHHHLQTASGGSGGTSRCDVAGGIGIEQTPRRRLRGPNSPCAPDGTLPMSLIRSIMRYCDWWRGFAWGKHASPRPRRRGRAGRSDVGRRSMCG
jgi:hypothetical protein